MMEAQAIDPGKPFVDADMKFSEIKEMLSAPSALGMSHSEVEALASDQGRELLRLLFQGHLDLRTEREEAPEAITGADGQTRTHRRVRSRDLVCLFGAVNVARTALGGRGMDSLAPMDAELNLPKTRYSFGVERRVVEEAIRGSFDEAIDAVARTTGVGVPKRQAEEMVRRASEDFEVFYAAGGGQLGREGPPTEDLLVLTVDGKGISMRPEGLREATRRAAEGRKHKLEKRLSKGEKRHRRRMATAASVYTISPHPRQASDIVRALRPVRDAEASKPPRAAHKRVWASVVEEPETVIADMFAEALRRDPERKMRWVAVVDGNKPQLRLLRKYAKEAGVELTIILDVIHVIEYLWKATIPVHGEGKPDTERLVTERLVKILEGKAVAVAAGIKQSATKRKLTGAKKKALVQAADYLLNNKEFLHYDRYLAAGTPIASGIIEGACRYLVKDRMDITGARWGLETAEAVLKMRALKASDDLDAYWAFHERQHWDRTHAARYQHRQPPSTALPERPKLTLLQGGA